MLDLESLGLLSVLFILTTIGLGALIKGVTGVGLPIFAVPALSMFMPVEQAVIIMALPGVVANLWLVFAHREHLQLLRDDRAFLVAGFLGALCGTWLLVTISDIVLKALLATWLAYYLLRYYSGSEHTGISGRSPLNAAAIGFIGGSSQGATGISAPIIAPYFQSYKLTPTAFAFAVAFTFGILAISQVIAIAGGSLFTGALLGYSLLATLATILVIPIGIYLGSRLDKETFNRILPIVLVVIEIKLVYDIVRALS